MRNILLLFLVLSVARAPCAENTNTVAFYFGAHPDDRQLFMNPKISFADSWAPHSGRNPPRRPKRARNAQNRHVDIPAPLSQYLACLVSPKTNSPSPAQRLVPVGAQKAISYQ